MKMRARQSVAPSVIPLVVYTVQKLVADRSPAGISQVWRYLTDHGEWSFNIMEAKTWSRSMKRFADLAAAPHMGAVVSSHKV